MKSLKSLVEDVFNGEEDSTIELPKQNLVVSFFEQEKRLNFSALDVSKPAPQARTFINELKQKFKVSQVKQQAGNVFVVLIDPREDFNLVIDFIKNAAN